MREDGHQNVLNDRKADKDGASGEAAEPFEWAVAERLASQSLNATALFFSG